MARVHLIEIHDQTWCPRVLRDCATEYLEFMIHKGKLYDPIAERLIPAVQRSGTDEITDLCSGGGGPWVSLYQAFQDAGVPVRVTLTDLYPNRAAFERVKQQSGLEIELHDESVDATRVPEELTGFRTLFSSFHHFRPEQARSILADAVAAGRGIAIVEGTKRSAAIVVFALLIPIVVFFATPFIRPFRLSRLFFTYIIPILPLLIWFDGIVSALRTYSPDELRALVADIDDGGYEWDIGELAVRPGQAPVTYLIATPPGRPSSD